MKEYPKIILTRPKLIVNTKCKKCNSRDIAAVPVIDFVCKNCSTHQETDVEIDMYASVAKAIQRKLKKHDGVYIVGERDGSKVFHPDNLLKPRSKQEDDVWHAMLEIKDTYENKAWTVSKITNEYDYEYYVRCLECGYCQACVLCTRCSTHYVPKKIKGGKEKRYTCPECGNKNYTQTKIKKFKIDNKGNTVCPHCNSSEISSARFSSDRKKCPKCSSDNISKPRNIPVYRLLIEWQKRFMEHQDE